MKLDDALQSIGEYGKFQLLVQVIFFCACLPQSFQVYIMVFAAKTPSWKCARSTKECNTTLVFPSDDMRRCNMPRSAWTYVEDRSYSIVTDFNADCGDHWVAILSSSIYFIGIAFGSMILGWVGDNYGRKKVLIPSVSILVVCAILSAVSWTPAVLIVLRFMIGIAASGGGVTMFTMIAELVGSKYRALAMQIICSTWSVALLFLTFIAYLLQNWRRMMLVASTPFLIVLPCLMFVPESIRWLQAKNRKDDVHRVLDRIAKWNDTTGLLVDIEVSNSTQTKFESKTYIMDLFRNEMKMLTAILFCAVYVTSMAFYTSSLAADDFGGSMYINLLISSLAEIPSAFAAAYAVERFGRRNTVITNNVIATISCGLIAFLPFGNSLWHIVRLVAGGVGKFSIAVSYFSLFTWTAEIYPTKLRTQGMGFLLFGSKIGGATAPWVAKGLNRYHRSLPFGTAALFLLLITPTLRLLPETKGQGLCQKQGVTDKTNEGKYINSSEEVMLCATEDTV